MADNVDFFSLPQGADPEKDPVVGRDELGNPRYRSFLGTEYTLETQPVERNFESEPGTMARVKEVGSNIVEGAIEGVKSAVTAPRRAMEGEAVTYGDAFDTAGFATTGSAAITKPEGALSAGAARTKKKSEINPLFKPKTRNDGSLVTFYSPLRSAIEEMQFSEKGKSGQEIMAYLNKRAPNVSKGELDFSRLDLNPKKKYSKDEVLNNLQFSTEGIKANFIPREKARWEDTQVPRNYLDKTEDYFEITLDAEDLPEGIRTHHGDTTLGHSRATVHTSRKGDGDRYIVLNEIQSDALQNVGKKLDDDYGPADSVGDFIDGLNEELDFGVSDKTISILDFVAKEGSQPTIQDRKALIQKYKEEFGVEPQGRDIAVVHKDAIRQSLKETDSEIDFEGMGIEDDIDNLLLEISSYNPSSYAKSDIPIRGNTDYVKNLIIANIAKAREMGIDTVVVPDLKEIARLRADDFGGEIGDAIKALKPTYVDAVKKAVRVLNNEYGDRIKLGTKDIDYEDLTKPNKTRTTKGLALDISNFDFDPRSEVVRFAEGGQVRSKEDNPIWQHHQKNVDEGTYVKNDDGSISTVYTTIMGDGEYEYLIPQVWDGKILSEDEAWERAMSSGIDWPREPAGEEGVRKLEQLDEQLHENMSGYADGGQVKSMEEQMNLFEYGGLADDGMDREPVTGNEIPPGSMAKEVRDDVPAMLSEGEYVVPADVVRYYGVKFFEDLRSEAKSGMLDMEEDGRIGGEPVNADGIPMEGQEEELTPEEMAMLQEALASDVPQMATGGMVRGYAPGGDVTQPQFTYSPGQPYPMGSGYGVGAYSPTGGFEARQYVNEQTGQVRTFQFLNGQPISYIPPNFKPYVGATQQSQKTETTLDDDVAALVKKYEGEPGDGGDAMDPGATRGRSYDTMTDDELAEAEKSLDMQANITKGFGLFAGPIGLLANLANRVERNQLNKAKNMPLESRMENRYQGSYKETTEDGVMVFSPTEDTTRPPDLPPSVQARWSNQQPQQPPAPVPNITTTTLAPAPQSPQATPSVPTTPTAPIGLTGTAETPAGTKAEPMFAYTSGNLGPTGTPPSEPATPSLQAPSFPSIQAQQQALDVALDEAIFGIDYNQPGQLTGGKDVTPDVVANVATQAAIARAANMEATVSLDAFGGKGPNVGPTSTSSPSVSISAASPSISGAMSAARGGFGTSKGGEFAGTPTDTSVNNAYSGLANAVGDPNTSSPTSGTANNNAPSSAQSAASMGFGTSRGGEFSGGADPSGPTGGGKGGGGADSGQAAAAADAANSGPTAGGVSADTADDGTVGDIGALFNKGGLVTKKKKKRKGLGGRP